jgi:hypothetical protein
MTPDDEPTQAELEEAEALARALESGHVPPARDRGRGQEGPPEDALGAAAFLRYAKDGGSLDATRADAILSDALARVRPPVQTSRGRAWGWRLFGALGFATAAAAAALIVARAPLREESASTLPAPPRALLEAQIDAAGGRVASLDALTVETNGYRRAVYGVLHDRYDR